MTPPRPRTLRSRGAIQVEVLLLLVLLPVGGFLFVAAERHRRRALRQIAGNRGESQGRIRERRSEFFCMIGAAGMIVLALSRPAWKEVWIDAQSEGRDVIFLLDVSRSMLADDLPPSRLEAAKTAIRDCVASLEGGDRLGLVVFSGSASILCPLTTDYAFFFDKLDEAHPDYVAPGDVRVGGTRIGDAIRKTADKLLDHERAGLQDLILLSDGGDQESSPEEAASRLEYDGTFLIVAGLGDKIRGARIPARGEDGSEAGFTMHEGREVWSRLETGGLEAMARACRNGVFLDAGTRVLPLGEIYPELVKHFRRRQSGTDERFSQKQETFPVFLAVALLLLAPPVFRLLRWRPVSASAPAALVLCLLVLIPEPASAGREGVRLYNEGCKQLEAKNYAVAVLTFARAAEALPDVERSLRAIYNAGSACFGQAMADEVLDPQSSLTYYSQAVESFRACLRMQPDFSDAAWNLELALARRARIAEELEQQMPQDEDQASDDPSPEEGEGEEESSEEEGEGEGEESEAEGATEPSDQAMGPNTMDLEAQDIPPPMVEPEDLFEQEMQSDEVRQKNQSSNYKPVEKDW